VSQAKRRKALAPVRERERVARELAALFAADTLGADVDAVRSSRSAALLMGRSFHFVRIKAGKTFDVHASREHAQALIERAHRETGREHRAVFSDWRMWNPTTPASESPLRSSGRARSWERLGRAILRALEGQPSECQADGCDGGYLRAVERFGDDGPDEIVSRFAAAGWNTVTNRREKIVRVRHYCPDCHGTGHNLRGTLPPVEWSPAVRRRAMDCFDGRASEGHGLL
jgi:hypothetical protein